MANRRQPYRQPKDPFVKHRKGGRLQYKDYTKYIQWTPIKVVVFILCIGIPYLSVAIAVGLVTAPFVGVLMLAIPGIVAILGAAFYWLLKQTL